MPKQSKSLVEQCMKVTVRFTLPQAEKIAEECERQGIKPAQCVRIASENFVNHKYLDLKTMMQQVFDEQIRLRRDFNDAVVDGE